MRMRMVVEIWEQWKGTADRLTSAAAAEQRNAATKKESDPKIPRTVTKAHYATHI